MARDPQDRYRWQSGDVKVTRAKKARSARVEVGTISNIVLRLYEGRLSYYEALLECMEQRATAHYPAGSPKGGQFMPGKGTGGGAGGSDGLESVDGDTPVPANVGKLLDTWTGQGGNQKLSSSDHEAVLGAVATHGEKVPAELHRGINVSVEGPSGSSDEHIAKTFAKGKTVNMGASSFSTDDEVAGIYADDGEGRPVIMHLTNPGHVKGLNVQGRARKHGFEEDEWITGGHFIVHKDPFTDEEDMTHVYITAVD